MNPIPSIVRSGLMAYTVRWPLWPAGSGLVGVPKRYLKVNWRGSDAGLTPFHDSLIRLAQIVLGLEVEGKMLEMRLTAELRPASFHEPVLFLMRGRVVERGEELPLAGAAWGAVASVLVIQSRLKAHLGIVGEGLRCLGDKLRFLGYEEPARLMFVDEFLVHWQASGGFEPPVVLARLLFEHALENGRTAVLVWTKPQWPFTPFWKALGFGEIFRIGGFRFLLNEDVRPALKLLQNRGEEGYEAWWQKVSWLPGLRS